MTTQNDLATGFNILLEGPTGTGKTHSLGTLVDTGMETFGIFLESGQESLYGYWTDRGKSVPSNLHVHTLGTSTASFTELLDSARKTNTLSHKALAEMIDPQRTKYDAYFKLLNCLNNFTDQRNGQSYGPVDKWGTDRAIFIDGLTGINAAAMQLVVGGKAVKSQTEWGQAQHYVRELLSNLCNGCRCHFILLSHVDREVDAVLGGSKITMATLGKALAPILPQMFSDVALCKRNGDKWVWSTTEASADLKARNLPWADNITPNFAPIVTKWQSRMHGVQDAVTQSQESPVSNQPNAGA